MDKNKILIDLSESKRTDFGKVDFAEQSEEQKVFSAIWKLAVVYCESSSAVGI